MSRIPTTIVTGFLGSGKTTVIGHLIDYLQAGGQQVVYVKNEVGDTDIDGQIMASKGDGVVARELLNGCICCTLVGPFISSINETVASFEPDRIIIEASGAADPAALAMMVSSHPLLLRDGVISIIDVVNFDGYLELTTTARQQTQFTDVILFNKVELADIQRKQAVVGYVRELNTHSPILETVQGVIAPQLVFGLNNQELELLLKDHELQHDHHIEDDGLQSVRIRLTQPVAEQQIIAALEKLPQNVFRVKGLLVNTENKSLLINRVGLRTTIEPLTFTLSPAQAQLIFIGFQLKKNEAELHQWAATLSSAEDTVVNELNQ